MNKVTKIIAAVLVLAGVLLAVLALHLTGRQEVRPASSTLSQTAAPQYSVVVAARALEAGTPVMADSLKIVNLPNRLDGSFANAADVIGHVPRVTIAADAPITLGALAHGMAQQLAAGERAVAIPVNEVTGVGNRIKPGDYVDVFFTLKLGQAMGETQSRLLASHLRVLSYGVASLDDAPSTASKIDMKTQQSGAMTAVLAVPVDQVNPIALATQNGKLLLALRPSADGTQPDTSLFAQPPPVLSARAGLGQDRRDALDMPENRAYAGIALAGLAGDARATIKRPAAPRAGVSAPSRTIEVIRGAQRESAAY